MPVLVLVPAVVLVYGRARGTALWRAVYVQARYVCVLADRLAPEMHLSRLKSLLTLPFLCVLWRSGPVRCACLPACLPAMLRRNLLGAALAGKPFEVLFVSSDKTQEEFSRWEN